MEDNRIVDGYMFGTARETIKAKEEFLRIQKIKDKIDINNVSEVQKLYKKLVEKRYFETFVGISFMHEMREYVIEKTGDKSIPPVPIPTKVYKEENTGNDLLTRRIGDLEKEKDEYKSKSNKLVIAVIAMCFIIVGMFLIIVTNENVGYFNAEEKLLNKYSAWEERLDSREKELDERELEFLK